MLAAIAQDFARIEGCEVVTTWDGHLGPPGFENRIQVLKVDSPSEEQAAFRQLASSCDATFVIAPEFDGVLAERCRWVAHVGGKLVGPSVEAVKLCSDKLA